MESDDEDVRLMEHNKRFQDAVLGSMERQMEVMQNALAAKASEVEDAVSSKEQLALSLAHVSKELKRVQELFAKANKDTEEATSRSKSLATLCSGYKRDMKAAQSELDTVKQERDKLRGNVSVLTAQVASSDELRRIYASDLKAQQTVVESLKMEVATAEGRAKQAEDREKRLIAENQKANSQVFELMAKVEAAETENANTQAVFAKMQTDMRQIEASKDAMLKQWEHAVHAMTHRDEVITQVSKAASEAKATLTVVEASESTLAAENKRLAAAASELQHRSKDVEASKERLVQQVNKLKQQKESLQHQLTSAKAALSHATHERQLAEERAKRLEESAFNATNEARMSKGVASELEQERRKLDTLLERRSREHSDELKKTANKLDQDMAQIKTRLAEKEHALSLLQVETLEAKRQQARDMEETAQMRKEMTALLDRLQETSTEKYVQEMELERTREKLLRAQKMVGSRHTGYELELREKLEAMQRQMEDKEKEIKQYSRALVDAERRNAEAAQLRNQAEERANFYAARGKQGEILSEHDRLKVEKLGKKERIRNRETALLELRALRQEEQANKYRAKNAQMAEKLQTETFRHQLRSQEHDAKTSVLQAATSTLQSDCNMLKRDLQFAENQLHAMQAKLQVATERLTKEKAENARLAQQLFDAQQRQKMQERMISQTKHATKMLSLGKSGTLASLEERSQSQARSRQARLGVSPRLKPIDQRVDQSGASQTRAAQDPELVKKLKRATTQAAERRHEILLLKEQLQNAAESSQQHADLELAQRVHKLQVHSRIVETKLVEVRERLLRAHAVAAKMESELESVVRGCKCKSSSRFKPHRDEAEKKESSVGAQSLAFDFSPDFSLVSNMSPALRDALGGTGGEANTSESKATPNVGANDDDLSNIRSVIAATTLKTPHPPHDRSASLNMHTVAHAAMQAKRAHKKLNRRSPAHNSQSGRKGDKDYRADSDDAQLNRFLAELRSL